MRRVTQFVCWRIADPIPENPAFYVPWKHDNTDMGVVRDCDVTAEHTLNGWSALLRLPG
jgi:hypothetical protein